ncbi:MAG: hypothetical protein ACJAR3_000908 [Roseivirga sp.]
MTAASSIKPSSIEVTIWATAQIDFVAVPPLDSIIISPKYVLASNGLKTNTTVCVPPG